MADLRIAILDSDSGFVRVLVKRAADLGWQYRCLEAAPPVEEFVAMRVNALVSARPSDVARKSDT